MNFVKANITKIVFCAFALLAISTVYAKTASASRYAIAYDFFGGTCTGSPGTECD